jgi:hypothetical protein
MTAAHQSAAQAKSTTEVSTKIATDIASRLASQWAADDFNIGDAHKWDPVAGATYDVETLSPSLLTASVDTSNAHLRLENDEFADRNAEVFYSPRGVLLGLNGTAGEHVRGGALATFEPEEARQLAAALLRAAEELDRRPSDGK